MTKKISGFKVPVREVIAWSLFDWANSAFPVVIMTFIFATYFTQSVAVNPVVGTHQWGNAISFSGVIIAMLSPILGSIADKMGKRKPWIVIFSVLTMLSAVLLWFVKPSSTYVTWALIWVVIGMISFQITTVFYNATLRDLAEETHWGRLSGWGWGCGYAGGLVCLALSLFLLRHPPVHFDLQQAEQVRLSGPLVAIWFALFSLPFFLLTQDQSSTRCSLRNAVKQGLSGLYLTLSQWRNYKNIFLFLLASMIYLDGLNTLFAFGGIYAAGTFGFKTQSIILFGIATNVSAGIGAVALAWLDDYIGAKKTILISLGAMVISGIGILLVHSVLLFLMLALFLSLFVGPVQAASRSFMTRLAPKEKTTELFGLYVLSGKVTAFLCPWLVGLITLYFNSQRIGMSVVMLFLILGAVVLRSVR